jgi:hypothetical protein
MEKNIGQVKHFSSDDLRFATPVEVASYRARRLKCKVIVDLCSGIGIQSGAFAKTCGEVYSFEIDERKVEYSKKNFKDFKNLKFEVGNVLSNEVIEKVKKIGPDVIFCDPERLPSEKERNLDSIKPDVFKLLEVYSEICPNICLEIPPQIDKDKLDKLGSMEKEYLSFNNKLNRLDLYFGNLKKADISVIDAVSEEMVSSLSNSKENSKFVKTNKTSKYIYEISTAVAKAGLESEFANEISGNIVSGSEKNKILITSDKLDKKFRSLSKIFEVIGANDRFNEVIDTLIRFKIGKVVVKYSVDPKDYWKERNKYENLLHGNSEAVLFLVDKKYVICRGV